jgi:hypothetical protein
MEAPLGSVTIPLMLPVTFCPHAIPLHTTSIAATTNNIVRRTNISSFVITVLKKNALTGHHVSQDHAHDDVDRRHESTLKFNLLYVG